MNNIHTREGRWLLAGLLMLTLTGSSWAADDAQIRVLGNWLTHSKDVII